MEAPILTKEQLDAMDKSEREAAMDQIADHLRSVGADIPRDLKIQGSSILNYVYLSKLSIKRMLAEAYLAGVAAGKESSKKILVNLLGNYYLCTNY